MAMLLLFLMQAYLTYNLAISLYEKDLQLMNMQMENLCEEAEKIRTKEIGIKKKMDEQYGP